MRRAARIDANQPAVVRALREEGASVTHLHKVGEGCPDLLIAVAGQWGMVEVKDGSKPPSAQKRTPAQIEWWDANVNGGARAIVTDEEGARRFVRMLKAADRYRRELDAARKLVADSGKPSLSELCDRLAGYDGPEVSGNINAKP